MTIEDFSIQAGSIVRNTHVFQWTGHELVVESSVISASAGRDTTREELPGLP